MVRLEIHRTDPQGQPQQLQIELPRGAPMPMHPVPGASPSAPQSDGAGGGGKRKQGDVEGIGAITTSEKHVGQQGGLGITFSRNRRGIFIITALVPGGPAFQSKMLQVRDALVSVDGNIIKDISGDELAAQLVGPVNTTVCLRVLRKQMREVADEERGLDETLGNSQQHAGERSIIDVTLVREVLARDASASAGADAAGADSPARPTLVSAASSSGPAPPPAAPKTLIVDDGELWQMVLPCSCPSPAFK